MEIGESPLWDDATGELLWVDTMLGSIAEGPAGPRQRQVPLGRTIGGCDRTYRVRVNSLAAVRDGFGLVREDGSLDLLAEVESGQNDMRMNDGGCDPLGRFWAGSMELRAAHGRGSLYRLDEDLVVHRTLEGLGCSNGIGWSPDGRRMYYIDSPLQRVDVFDFDAGRGDASNRRPLCKIPAEDGIPDGLSVDREGFVWVALWGGGRVLRFAADGTLDLTVRLPVTTPTSCAFGGDDLDILYITTASIASDEADLAMGAGGVFRCRPGVQGAPVARFRGL